MTAMLSSLRLSVLLFLLGTLAFFYQEPRPPVWDPHADLPFPESHYGQAAGCTQQTYCPESNVPGLDVGDAKLLFTIGNSDVDGQRINLYRSPSLGIVVAYAGTNVTSPTSMAVNDDFFPTKGDELLGLPIQARVQGGPQTAWRRTWDPLLEAIRKEDIAHPTHRFTVSGHSMGAQLAILASVALERLYKDKVYVITFGQPRVGNRAFADHIDTIYRTGTSSPRLSYVVNGHDYTSRLPPTLLGYRQFSGQVFIYPGNSTKYRVLQGQEHPDGAASDWWPGISFDDHQGSFMGTTLGDLHACPARVGDRL